jgi:hypothetical protein
MIFHELEQGSPEWHNVRMGIPTASQMHRILTPSRGELATGRFSYAYELVAERLLKETKQNLTGMYWPERGRLLEFDAVRHYEFVHSCRTAKVGFVTPDHGMWGCSPDRIMVDDLGTLELKCPSPEVHLKYFAEGPGNDYKVQLQATMMITGFPWADFMSYHPQLPDALYRFERDDAFIDKLHKALSQFVGEVDAIEKKVRDAGFVSTVHQQYDEGYGEMLRSDMNAAGHIIEQGSWGG